MGTTMPLSFLGEDLTQQIKSVQHFRIGHRVENLRAASASRHQRSHPQDGEVLGEVCLSKAKPNGEIAHRTLDTLQGIEDQDPFGIGEGLAKLAVEKVDFSSESLVHDGPTIFMQVNMLPFTAERVKGLDNIPELTYTWV